MPHNIMEYPGFIKGTLLGVYMGFAPFIKIKVMPFYILAFIFGLFALYKQRKDIFYICILSLFIYVALSLFRIYPFGHEGVAGGRLSLFMSVIFYIPICYFLYVLYHSSKKYIKYISIFITIALVFATFGRYGYTIFWKHEFFVYQQTHAHITNMANNMGSNDKIFIYSATKPAFLYYSHLEKIDLPYEVFGKDFDLFRHKLQKEFDDGANIWILLSHHIHLQTKLLDMVKQVFLNTADLAIDMEDEVMFIKIMHKKVDAESR